MAEHDNTRAVENENLFRAMICAPAAIAFGALTTSTINSSGFGFINLFFILLTLYFSLSALGYAALYTNDRYEGRAESIFKNQNLAKTIVSLPLAVLFVALTYYSVSVSSSVFFNVVYGVIAFYFVLATLGYASHYTNDYFEQSSLNPEH